MSSETSAVPGAQAEAPLQIPPRGWWQVVRRALAESTADNVPMLAGGVAFFGFLAVFPALIAAVSVYGLVADPSTVAAQLADLAAVLPRSAQPLVADQLTAVAGTSGGALGIGLVVSLLAALWSSSGGTANLIKAVNIAYDEDESRGTLRLRALALALTVGAIVFVLLTLALVALMPVVLDALPLGAVGRLVAQVLRWVVLIGLVVAALALVYRVAPDRDAPRLRWVSAGALVAAGLWLLGSVAFSLYVNFFGNYNKTYGALGGVVVLLLWLYLTSYIVLLGAEVNAESERQTRRDTTTGPQRPLGDRGAFAADTVADTVAGESASPPQDDRSVPVDRARNGYQPDMPEHPSAPEGGDRRSISTGDLVSRLSGEVSGLVRAELALARSELRAKGARLGMGAGLAGGAGLLAVGGLLALLVAAIAALALVLPTWVAAVLVGVVLLGVAGVLALLGRRQVRQALPPVPEQAVHGAQRDVQVIKEGLSRGA
jgi:membrane protein